MNKSNSRKMFDIFSNQASHLYELSLRKEKYSEYLEKTDIKDIITFFKNEIDELLEAIEDNNEEEINKELSDVIYMLNMTILKLLGDNHLNNFENFGKKQKTKIFNRAKHLKQGKKIALEQEKKNWRKEKEES